ncbi:MAG: hypothetical protein JO139_10095 [Alphaproteobacteria bacterium]|nr:hypothetical protein [Alphaproteobacteria bacterium]MBV8335703.1 hypothetical protein [Alphaproteobacteria bacterium]
MTIISMALIAVLRPCRSGCIVPVPHNASASISQTMIQRCAFGLVPYIPTGQYVLRRTFGKNLVGASSCQCARRPVYSGGSS